MKALKCVTLAFAVALLCPAAQAAPVPLTPDAAAKHAAAGSAARERLIQAGIARSKAAPASTDGTNAATATGSGPRVANEFRAYPPSCLADPLPTTPTHALASFPMQLYSRDNLGQPVDPVRPPRQKIRRRRRMAGFGQRCRVGNEAGFGAIRRIIIPSIVPA